MSSSSFSLHKGSKPLLISMPHNGSCVSDDIAATMTEVGKSSIDTDWYMDKLYDFAVEMGVWIIQPKYSRYVIDLNRDPKGVNLYPGANSTELCPTTSFELEELYLTGKKPDANEIDRRIQTFWQPYHSALASTLSEMKERYSKVVLLDAHSIRSEVPRFFEGQLPDFNFGTADGKSCDPALLEKVISLDYSPYTQVANGRFKGGYITRAYGQPAQNIHSIQLELSQRTYMKEPTADMNQENAAEVKPKLADFVRTLIEFAEQK